MRDFVLLYACVMNLFFQVRTCVLVSDINDITNIALKHAYCNVEFTIVFLELGLKRRIESIRRAEKWGKKNDKMRYWGREKSDWMGRIRHPDCPCGSTRACIFCCILTVYLIEP